MHKQQILIIVLLAVIASNDAAVSTQCLNADTEWYDVCHPDEGVCQCTNENDDDKVRMYKVDCRREKICFPNLKQPKDWKIRIVDLSNNLIQQIDDCAHFLPFMRDTLEYLYLNNNQLSYINPKCFKDFKKLRLISIANNSLESFTHILPSELDSLKVLELQSNMVVKLEARTFAHLKSLKKLDISGNKLKSISDDAFQIEDDNGDNPLLELKIDSTKMSFEDVADENDYSLPFLKHLNKLKIMSMKDTNFDSLPIMKGLRSLQQFDFSSNDEVTELAGVHQFENLQIFRMNDCNKLTVVHNNTFSKLKKLADITMTDNPNLVIFYDDAFGPEPNFNKTLVLNLMNNNLKSLNLHSIDLDQIGKIKLAGNPRDSSGWTCNANALWLLKAYKKGLVESPSVVCSSNSGYRDMPLDKLSELDLTTESPPGALAFTVVSVLVISLSLIICSTYRSGKLPCCKPPFRATPNDGIRFGRMRFDSANNEDPVFDYHSVTIPTEDVTMEEPVPNTITNNVTTNNQQSPAELFSDDFEPNPYPQP